MKSCTLPFYHYQLEGLEASDIVTYCTQGMCGEETERSLMMNFSTYHIFNNFFLLLVCYFSEGFKARLEFFKN